MAEADDHGFCVALCTTPGAPPMEVFPAPPARCTREMVISRVNAFLSVARWELLRLKRQLRLKQLTDQAQEPAKAGVALSFPSPAKLHEVMQLMRAGETVNPTEHGLLATYCSDGLYEHAASFAAQNGRAFKDVLVYVLTAYVDLAGQEQALRSVLLDPVMAGE